MRLYTPIKNSLVCYSDQAWGLGSPFSCTYRQTDLHNAIEHCFKKTSQRLAARRRCGRCVRQHFRLWARVKNSTTVIHSNARCLDTVYLSVHLATFAGKILSVNLYKSASCLGWGVRRRRRDLQRCLLAT